MMAEVKAIERDNKKQLEEYYMGQLHNTIVRIFPGIQTQESQLKDMVRNTKERYGIEDTLEAIKKTLHNIDDLLIIFDDNIKRLRRR